MKPTWLFVLLFFAGAVISESAFSQNKKLDKKLKKVDRFYNAGRFPKAQKELRKFRSRAVKLGTESHYMIEYYIREARINLASGLLNGFETSLNNALATSEKVFGFTSNNFATTLTDVADMYNEYGNFRIARDYITKAEEVLVKSGQMNEALNVRITFVRAEAMIGQGFCKSAIRDLRNIEDYVTKRAVEKETIVDGGGIKTQRVPENELMQRFRDYNRLMTLLVRAYGKSGNTDAGDSILLGGIGDKLRKNQRYLGETSLEYIEFRYMHALSLWESMEISVNDKTLEFDNILNDLKKRVAPTQTLGHELYLSYLKELLSRDATNRYMNVQVEYEKVLKKYFPKNSVAYANLAAVEFSGKLHRDKTKNLEVNALSMLNAKSVPKNYRTSERIYRFLVKVALIEKRYANAETYFNEIVSIRRELYGETSPEYHLAKLEMAAFYMDFTNKLDEAGKIFEQSFTGVVEKEIHTFHKDYLEILNHIAKYYEFMDKYALAKATLEKAALAARAKFTPDDPTRAIELDYLANLYLRIGNYEEAEESLKTALEVLEKERKDDKYIGDYIHALETQAKLFGIKGEFDEAENNLKRTAKLISKADVALDNELASAEELASLFIQLGRFSAADKLLNVQIPEYEKLYGRESLRLIEPLVNRGRILLAKGDYTEAERTAQRANNYAVRIYGETSTKSAQTQKLLSDIYYNLGDYEKAESNIQKALASQTAQFGRDHVDVARSISQLALIKFYKGDNLAQIEKLFIEARDIMERKLGKGNPQYADILKNVAVLYISQARYDNAFNSLTLAEGIWRNKTGSKNNINAASIFTLTGDVYYQLKNYKKAEDFYNRSKDLYERVFSTKHPEYVKVLSKLAKVYYMEKDFKRSKKLIEESLTNYESFIKQYFPALSEREKAKYWNTIKSDFEFYNTLAFSNLEDFRDLTGKVYNYQLLTKALLLSSSIKIRERIMNSTDEELKLQYNNWVQKKELLTLALSMSPTQLSENGIETEVLQQEVERLEKDLSQKSEIFGQSFENKKITFDEVRKSLKANEVAMEMVRYRYFNHNFTDSVVYAALYVKNETSKPRAILLGDGKKMEGRYFKYYRNTITGKMQDNITYNVFWKTIQEELGQVSTIYLSADGIYNQINLESIPTPDGRYIIDNSNIVLVSNTKDIFLKKVKSPSTQKENTATLFGNPTFYLTASADGQSITPLPGTEREVNQLQYLLKEKGWATTEYISDRAAEEKIKELNSPKIFHIATHGLYRPTTQLTLEEEMKGNESLMAQNPLLRTGLLLRGAGDLLGKTNVNYNMESGILTAYEAMSLNLDKTDLVVLSACETGLGDLEAGEGVYGLQRAFLVAGAKVLIMSMFKVDDEATQKLMLKFYQKWFNTGNMRQSFIEAKKEIRLEYPEPIYWGAFMMIGLE